MHIAFSRTQNENKRKQLSKAHKRRGIKKQKKLENMTVGVKITKELDRKKYVYK